MNRKVHDHSFQAKQADNSQSRYKVYSGLLRYLMHDKASKQTSLLVQNRALSLRHY